MATIALIPGAGSDARYWYRVTPFLEAAGHTVIAADLPWDDDAAGQDEHAQAVVQALGDRPRQPLVLVAQSMGAFTAMFVCDRIPVDGLVLVAPMIGAPGESPGSWWTSSGQVAARREFDEAEGRDPDAPMDPTDLFLHDVAPDVSGALEDAVVDPPDAAFETRWTGKWPVIPAKVVAGRNDRLFPLDFVRRLASERVAVEASALDSGHLVALVVPEPLAAEVLDFVDTLPDDTGSGSGGHA